MSNRQSIIANLSKPNINFQICEENCGKISLGKLIWHRLQDQLLCRHKTLINFNISHLVFPSYQMIFKWTIHIYLLVRKVKWLIYKNLQKYILEIKVWKSREELPATMIFVKNKHLCVSTLSRITWGKDFCAVLINTRITYRQDSMKNKHPAARNFVEKIPSVWNKLLSQIVTISRLNITLNAFSWNYNLNV